MPELPEVEVTRRGLLPHLPGKKITRISWSNKRLRTPIPRKLLRDAIAGEQVRTVDRRAKYLLVRMMSGSVLILHLGMTGKIGLFPGGAPRARHDHLRLLLENGMEMRFNDSRRFGSILVWPAEHAVELEERFNKGKGIEPFSTEFTGDTLKGLAEKRRQPVKTFLMDSRLVAGIGNIYANETLFAVGIFPETPVNHITEAQWQAIAVHCQEILSRAIEAGGSTISDFIGSSGAPGYFQLQLQVYGRAGDPCSRCGAPIEKRKTGGRATFFCPRCQQPR
ncbi:MAG TPA: bifunctional DNA-formamidopyrimidine glycosylase/DNA-(apurinic or apyrimidinic site) lyase [Desulfobulbaceae bacterium]|nr:bifunctional DNA-formamidopyrimidine glycosylase/DNA-(apurinic or apyrimidinic site) lyase [Desulfobulbaceae bacterium]